MNYKVVYEAGMNTPSWGDIIISFLAIVSIIWTIYTVLHRKEIRLVNQFPIYFLSLFLTFISCSMWYGFFHSINTISKPYQKGDYEVAEGVVKNFAVTNKDGKELYENFTVNDVEFEIPDPNGLGYNVMSDEGGAISGDGQKIKISYIRYNDYWNIIMKLEVGNGLVNK